MNMNDAIEKHLELSRQYHEGTLHWQDYNVKSDTICEEYLKELGEITPAVREQWFINYGCANGWNKLTTAKFKIASYLHKKDCEAHPELHKMHESTSYTCYNVCTCTCGYAHSADSSD